MRRSETRACRRACLSNFLFEFLATHWAFALTGGRIDPVGDAVHVEAVCALADGYTQLELNPSWFPDTQRHHAMLSRHTYWAFVSGIFAFATSSFKLRVADAAGVIGILGEVPFPRCNSMKSCHGDFHGGERDAQGE